MLFRSELLYKYKEVINKIKAKFNPIAQFKDWYGEKFNAFILFKANNNARDNFGPRFAWDACDDLHTPENKSEFGKDNNLTEEYIYNYIKEYAKILHEDLNLGQYPHYAIIFKSISLVDENNEIHKLGNLYLHFATKDKKNKDFYVRFLNDFIHVWMEETGGRIIKKFIDDAKEITNNIPPHLPEFKGKMG